MPQPSDPGAPAAPPSNAPLPTARRPGADAAAADPGPAPAPPLEAGGTAALAQPAAGAVPPAPETGGPSGPEPTRYGDWERKGIAVDF